MRSRSSPHLAGLPASDQPARPPAHRRVAVAGCHPGSHHQALPRPDDQWRPEWRGTFPPHRQLRACRAAEGLQRRGCGRAATAVQSIERAKRPRKTAAEPGTVWHPAQLAAFLTTARGHRLFAFYHLAAYTGARRGELLNLRWRDIDLDAPEIRITGSAAIIAGKRIEGTTKSGRSRTVSLDADTVQVLRDHWKRRAQDRLKAGPEWKGADDYVFRTAWASRSTPTPSRRS